MSEPPSRSVRQALAVVAMVALVGYLAFFFTPPEVGGTSDTAGPVTTEEIESPTQTTGSSSSGDDGPGTDTTATDDPTSTQQATETRSGGSGGDQERCNIEDSNLPEETIDKVQNSGGTNLYRDRVSEVGPLTSQVFIMHGTEVNSGITEQKGAEAIVVGCGARIEGDLDVDTVVLRNSEVTGDLTGTDVTVFGDGKTTVDGDISASGQFTALAPVEAGGSVTCESVTVADSGRVSADGRNTCV